MSSVESVGQSQLLEVKGQQTPWALIVVGVLAAIGLFKGPEIIKAWKSGGDSVVPDMPVSGKLFASQDDAEYFSAAASHVSKILVDDGQQKTPRLATKEQAVEQLSGAFAYSVMLGGLKDKVDRAQLKKFIDLHVSGVADKAGPLDADTRTKLAAAWNVMAADALMEVK